MRFRRLSLLPNQSARIYRKLLWQIIKEKNQKEFVDVLCVPSFVGWVILNNGNMHQTNEMMNW
jgi:hypothetical protein